MTTIVAAGFRAVHACTAARITYRQIDYWDRTGFIRPELRSALGSGRGCRLYSTRDVVTLAAVNRLLAIGVGLAHVSPVVARLRENEVEQYAQITLVGNGALVVECHDRDAIFAAVRSGVAVYALDLAPVVFDVANALANLPAEVAQ